MRVVPRANEAVNEVWLSDRDRFSYEGLYADDRLLRPRVRDEDGTWRETGWETALDAAAGQLRAALGAAGPEAIGALASPAATTEEHYLLQALVRGLGGANLDHRLRQSDFRDEDEAATWPWLGMALADLERVDAALLVGSNVRKEQPLAGLRLRKAALAGAAVFALNSIDHPFHFDLAGRIVVSPERLADELAGIARALGALGVAEDSPAAGRDRMRARIEAELAGIGRGFGARAGGGAEPAAIPQEIARRLATAARPAILLGSGAGAHPEAARLRALARTLARLWHWRRGRETDGFDPAEEGARLGYLSDGPNAAGAALAGVLPHRGPGGAPAPARGLDAAAMLRAKLPAYVLLGTEPELDSADSGAALAALDAARSVIALTGYVSPAMERYASVLLPIGVFTETPGTFYNAEGRRQRYAAATSPPGEARPAWRVLRVLANRLGVDGFDHETIDDVRAEADACIGEVSPPDLFAGPGIDRITGPGSEPEAGARLGSSGGSGADVAPDRASAARAEADGASHGARKKAARAPDEADGASDEGAPRLWRVGEVPLYAVDPLVRRAPALQQTADVPPPAVRINPALARALGPCTGKHGHRPPERRLPHPRGGGGPRRAGRMRAPARGRTPLGGPRPRVGADRDRAGRPVMPELITGAVAWMPHGLQVTILTLVKILAIMIPLVLSVAYFTLAERKVIGYIQVRIGPNRVGPRGLFQPFADVIKLLLKEVIVPAGANRGLFLMAPVLALVTALSAWAVVPFDQHLVLADVNAGLLYILAMTSLGVYGVIIAGWASNSKYSLLGAMRSAAQIVAYEIAMGFALVGVLVAAGSLNLREIVLAQAGSVLHWFWLPLWPLFLVYWISGVAETNRAPFDVAEGESEIVAGFHVEYSGMSFALFFLAEYANMILIAVLAAVMFLGGWLSPFEGVLDLDALAVRFPAAAALLGPGFHWFVFKTALFCFVFLWMRATFPRYRYDQIMRLGWKIFIPVTLVWIVVVGLGVGCRGPALVRLRGARHARARQASAYVLPRRAARRASPHRAVPVRQEVHRAVPGGEDAAVAALPGAARASPLPQRRGAVHRLQALRGGVPGPRDHHRVRAARGRDAAHHPLRHRPHQVHLLRLLRGVLSGGLDRREYHGEERGDLLMTKEKLLAIGDRHEEQIARDRAAEAAYR